MTKMDYNEMVKELSAHWDEDNDVQPDYFGYNDLSSIYDAVSDLVASKIAENDIAGYKVTDLKFATEEKYAIGLGVLVRLPSYRLCNS